MAKEIAVVGSSDFTTGFRLAGVRKCESVPEDDKPDELEAAVETVFEDESVGIVVMHESDLEYLSRGTREAVERSLEPVLVTLGGGAASGGLRAQIKRAIGIDLMEE